MSFFADSGSTCVKAVCRTLMKLTPEEVKFYERGRRRYVRRTIPFLSFLPDAWVLKMIRQWKQFNLIALGPGINGSISHVNKW